MTGSSTAVLCDSKRVVSLVMMATVNDTHDNFCPLINPECTPSCVGILTLSFYM